jgi:hypothetical protein
MIFCNMMSQAQGSIANFFPSIVRTLGFNTTITLLLTAPPYVFAAGYYFGLTYLSDVSIASTRDIKADKLETKPHVLVHDTLYRSCLLYLRCSHGYTQHRWQVYRYDVDALCFWSV